MTISVQSNPEFHYQHSIANKQTEAQNLAAANSRIEDAEDAAETAVYLKNQFFSRAGLSAMSHTIVSTNDALTLLV